jgi:hypothetical protein
MLRVWINYYMHQIQEILKSKSVLYAVFYASSKFQKAGSMGVGILLALIPAVSQIPGQGPLSTLYPLNTCFIQ